MFRCQSTPVNIRTGSHLLLIAPPITYYTSDRCYCSILNSTPPSALDFIIPVGFLVFYKMFWFAAERAKEGAFLIRISFRVQLPSYLFPSISFPDSSELPSGAFYVCAVHYGGSKPNIFCNRRAQWSPPYSKPSRARAFVERGAARSFSVCLSAPRFLLDGVGTLTNSIWNVGRTPVNAGSGSQRNQLWSVVFSFLSLSLCPPTHSHRP